MVERLRAWCGRVPPLAADAGLAVVVAFVTTVAVAVQAADDESGPRLGAVGLALIAAQCVPLVWRRRAPAITGAVVGLAAGAYGALELPDPPVMFPALLAIYTLAAWRPRSVSVPFGLVASIGGVVIILLAGDSDVADVAVNYFVGVTAWAVGDSVRNLREQAVLLDARRAEAEQRAAAEERVRIARDLHDVVAHHISVIAVQAEAAQEVLAVRPDRAGQAMGRVADTAREALGELRRVVGVLRTDDGRGPAPDVAAIDDVVASVRGTGLDVSLRTDGEPRPVGGLVGIAAYRVVQEALTNVLKHADARHVEVALAYGEDLVVEVTDDGPARASAPANGVGGPRNGHAGPGPGARPGAGSAGGRGADRGTDRGTGPDGAVSGGPLGIGGGGHGLVGMRERVRSLGGDLDAGPRPSGGFAVRARLPLDR
jgi:signal transduction histidine kinase